MGCREFCGGCHTARSYKCGKSLCLLTRWAAHRFGSDDKTLKVWDTESGVEVATLRGHLNEVYACAYSPDGRRIVSDRMTIPSRYGIPGVLQRLSHCEGHTSWVRTCLLTQWAAYRLRVRRQDPQGVGYREWCGGCHTARAFVDCKCLRLLIRWEAHHLQRVTLWRCTQGVGRREWCGGCHTARAYK